VTSIRGIKVQLQETILPFYTATNVLLICVFKYLPASCENFTYVLHVQPSGKN